MGRIVEDYDFESFEGVTALDRCPFCGSRPSTETRPLYDSNHKQNGDVEYVILCDRCGIQSPSASYNIGIDDYSDFMKEVAEITAWWNNRNDYKKAIIEDFFQAVMVRVKAIKEEAAGDSDAYYKQAITDIWKLVKD